MKYILSFVVAAFVLMVVDANLFLQLFAGTVLFGLFVAAPIQIVRNMVRS